MEFGPEYNRRQSVRLSHHPFCHQPIMPESKLEHQYDIVASSGDLEDFSLFFQLLVQDVADVRVNLGVEDSVELRKAVADYLQAVVDKIRRTRNNKLVRPAGDVSDDV